MNVLYNGMRVRATRNCGIWLASLRHIELEQLPEETENQTARRLGYVMPYRLIPEGAQGTIETRDGLEFMCIIRWDKFPAVPGYGDSMYEYGVRATGAMPYWLEEVKEQ